MTFRTRRFQSPAIFGAAAGGGGGAYSGPGDITSGAMAWWGFRAYSASTTGTSCVDIIRASDSTTQTFVTLTNGNLDTASISTFLTSTTGKVAKLYDQTGNGFHVSDPGSHQPTYTPSVVGSLPGMTFGGSNYLTTAGNFVTQADPYFYSWAAKRTSNSTNYGAVLAQAGGQAIGGFQNVANTLLMYDGAFGTVSGASTTEGTFQAVENVFNGASSTFYYNGVGPTTVSVGTQGLSNTLPVALGAAPGGTLLLTGVILEAGIWLADKTSTQAALNANKKTYWGI